MRCRHDTALHLTILERKLLVRVDSTTQHFQLLPLFVLFLVEGVCQTNSLVFAILDGRSQFTSLGRRSNEARPRNIFAVAVVPLLQVDFAILLVKFIEEFQLVSRIAVVCKVHADTHLTVYHAGRQFERAHFHRILLPLAVTTDKLLTVQVMTMTYKHVFSHIPLGSRHSHDVQRLTVSYTLRQTRVVVTHHRAIRSAHIERRFFGVNVQQKVHNITTVVVDFVLSALAPLTGRVNVRPVNFEARTVITGR